MKRTHQRSNSLFNTEPISMPVRILPHAEEDRLSARPMTREGKLPHRVQRSPQAVRWICLPFARLLKPAIRPRAPLPPDSAVLLPDNAEVVDAVDAGQQEMAAEYKMVAIRMMMPL